ncbi:MAG: CbiX/SirB N-terminal domain-containing protein [Actinomycetota bacterium]
MPADRAQGQHLPPLLAVAHGSADPRAAVGTEELMHLVRDMARRSGLPGLDARTAYLGHAPPSVTQVLGALAGPEAPATQRVVVLPLLLTAAYHSEVDLPELLASASVAMPGLDTRYGQPLGPHPLLTRALERRLVQAGVVQAGAGTGAATSVPAGDLPVLDASPGEVAVVLAAAGSARPEANAVVAKIARQWQAARGWWAVVPAYAAAASPTPAEAVTALLGAGASQVVVATYLLAPGYFADRVAASSRQAGAVAVSGALGAAPEVAELVLRRYAAALAQPTPALTAVTACRGG